MIMYNDLYNVYYNFYSDIIIYRYRSHLLKIKKQ